MNSTQLASLISSRICHDLISPIGAIGNGVELLGMSGEADGPEMDLINDSVKSANGRIRFFRIAFGAAGPEQKVARSEITAILSDPPGGGRTTLEWLMQDDPFRRDTKLAFLALQCIETALPLGGDVRVEQDGADWVITAQADKISIDEDLWAPLVSGASGLSEVSAAKVQFVLLPLVLSEYDRKMSVVINDRQIVARFAGT